MIAAIPTRYAGCDFRSQLEARWAMFFSDAGIPWEYEVEGYELDGIGRYLPDFWLPSIETFFEVKGVRPTQPEADKASALEQGAGHRVLIAWGSMSGHERRHLSGDAYDTGDGDISPVWDQNFLWCACPKCGKIDAQFEGDYTRNCRCNATAAGAEADHGNVMRLRIAIITASAWKPAQWRPR